MGNISPQQIAGKVLRNLVQQHYSTQEAFTLDYGMDIRTLSRYINNGINKIDVIQELAEFFNIEFTAFFDLNMIHTTEEKKNG